MSSWNWWGRYSTVDHINRCPVPPDTRVDVAYCDGGTMSKAVRARCLDWRVLGTSDDILQWRVTPWWRRFWLY